MRAGYRHMLIVAGAAVLTLGTRAAAKEDLEETVQYLLQVVEKSDLVFIRNGAPHSPTNAAVHMRKKYGHFRKKKKIKTPEDFIKLAGTKSLLSGKPYSVRMKNGKTVPCGKWLQDVLDRYRKKKARRKKPTAK